MVSFELTSLGVTPTTEYDRLVVGGDFTAAGTLDIDLIALGDDPFEPRPGDSFDILDFAGPHWDLRRD